MKIFLLLFLLFLLPLFSETITFDTFATGTNLSQLNTAMAGQGISFDAYQSSSLQVATDPNNASNKVLFAYTHPSGADILLNFANPVNFINVQFVNNTAGTYTVVLRAYDHTGTAIDIQSTPYLTYASGTEPQSLQITASNIRAIQLESSSGGIYVDNIQYLVPEPFSWLLLMIGFCFFRKNGSRK